MGPQSAKSIAGQKPVHAPEPDKPAERARQEIDAGDRLRAARQRLHLRRVPPSDRRGVHPSLRRAHHRPLGGFPGADGPVAARRGGGGLRDPGQPLGAPGGGRAAVQSGPPALGVRVPARLRGVPEPDRSVVEDAALAGAEGPPLRDLGRDRAGGGGGDGLLEAATAYWNLHRHPFVWGRRRRFQ